MKPRKYRNYSLAGTLALLILIAVVIGGIWLWVSGGLFAMAGDGRDFTESVPATGIHSVRVDYPGGSVNVISTSDNEIAIREFQRIEGEQFTHSVASGTLLISGDNSQAWWDFLLGRNKNQLVLELPEPLISDLELMEIKTSSGDISSDEIKAINILLRTSSGNIQDVKLDGAEINAVTSSGDIRENTLKGGTLTLSSSSGDVRNTVADAEEVTIETASGAIRDVRITAEGVRFKTSSGNIRNSSFDAGKTLVLSTSSGNIENLELASERAELNTSSGNIKTSLNATTSILKAVSGNIEASFTDRLSFAGVQTTSGNIQVHAPFDVDILAGVDMLEEGQADPARKTIAVATGSGDVHVNEVDMNEVQRVNWN